ncbi:MAG TPA: glycosyl hydrolase family 8 [Mucilaginibacter sp.]
MKTISSKKLLLYKPLQGLVTVILLSLLSIQSTQVAAQDAKPDDGKGYYKTKKYRNYFKDYGHTDKEASEKIERTFQQLFYGDTAHATAFEAGKNENGPLMYVSDVPHYDIRTEGMSYGMMICVQLNKKKEFDAIWNYCMTYMYISDKAHPSEGYFSWHLNRKGEALDETPAPDGEQWYAMALYFAANRWGNGKGIYDYHAWADKILTAIRHREVKTGPTKFGPRTLGSMINEEHKIIKFVPDVTRGNFTDASYHLPAFYELFARWGPKEDRAFWAAAADTSRNFFSKATNPVTGLAPDQSNFDATPMVRKSPRGEFKSNFSFDSWRTQSNWAVDWVWWQKDPREQELSDRILTFFASKGMDTYGDQYMLNGDPINTRAGLHHSGGLIATNGASAMAATKPELRKEFIEALWNQEIPHDWVERYYDSLLYLMSLMHVSGNYRIYAPK